MLESSNVPEATGHIFEKTAYYLFPAAGKAPRIILIVPFKGIRNTCIAIPSGCQQALCKLRRRITRFVLLAPMTFLSCKTRERYIKVTLANAFNGKQNKQKPPEVGLCLVRSQRHFGSEVFLTRPNKSAANRIPSSVGR